jgi:hypothetical protein
MKIAWAIYHNLARIEDLRFFKTKKDAQKELNRIYGGPLLKLGKMFSLNNPCVIKVQLHTPKSDKQTEV